MTIFGSNNSTAQPEQSAPSAETTTSPRQPQLSMTATDSSDMMDDDYDDDDEEGEGEQMACTTSTNTTTNTNNVGGSGSGSGNGAPPRSNFVQTRDSLMNGANRHSGFYSSPIIVSASNTTSTGPLARLTSAELGFSPHDLEQALPLPPAGIYAPPPMTMEEPTNAERAETAPEAANPTKLAMTQMFGTGRAVTLQVSNSTTTPSGGPSSAAATTTSAVSGVSSSGSMLSPARSGPPPPPPPLHKASSTSVFTSVSQRDGEGLDQKLIDLLMRCYRSNNLDDLEKHRLYDFMFSNSPKFCEQHQVKALHLFTGVLIKPGKKKPNEKIATFLKKATDKNSEASLWNIPVIKVSKFNLDFGIPDGEKCPLKTVVSDEIVIKNKGKPSVKFFFHQPSPPQRVSIKINPTLGEVKKGQQVRVKVDLSFNRSVPLRELLVLEVEGGARYYFAPRVSPEIRQFGVDPLELDCTTVNGVAIPTLLFQLKNCLVEHDGFRQEGIFRKAGDERMTQQIKEGLNRGKFRDCDDVHVVANLIKIFFRELPQSLFSYYDEKQLQELRADDAQQCSQLAQNLPDPHRTLLFWLLDLMCEVVHHKEHNKMDTKNIAIVISPNLYHGKSDNPILLIMLSQKLTQLIHTLLLKRLEDLVPVSHVHDDNLELEEPVTTDSNSDEDDDDVDVTSPPKSM